jgi:uncharacterized protein YjbI with pentapeptide repeats
MAHNGRNALILALLAHAAACGQTPASVTPDQLKELQDTVTKLKAEKEDKDKTSAEIAKLKAETEKLRNETEKLKNENALFPGLILAILQGIGTILVAIVAWIAGKKFQDAQTAKTNQEATLTREDHGLQTETSRRQHDLENFRALGEPDPRVRIGAVSVLAQRVLEINEKPEKTAIDEHQRRTIVRVLIAVTKHEKREEIQKYIADRLLEILRARIEPGSQPEGRESPMAKSKFDLQGARLTNAWWECADLRGADLYSAQLTRAGLAGSYLQNAVLKNAILVRASLWNRDVGPAHAEHANLEGVRAMKAKAREVCFNHANLKDSDWSEADFTDAHLRNADLRNADLSNAKLIRAKLQGADLSTANLAGADLTDAEADATTKFPPGFPHS